MIISIPPFKKQSKAPLIVLIAILLIPLAFITFVITKNLLINHDIPVELYTLKDAMSDGYLSGIGIKPVQNIKDIIKKSDCLLEATNFELNGSDIKFKIQKCYFGDVKDGQFITLKLPENMQKTPPKFDNVESALFFLNKNGTEFLLSDGYSSVFYIKNSKVYPANDITDAYKEYIGQSKNKFAQDATSKK